MMPGCCSSSRSRLGPDLGLMRLLCITFLAFCTARIFEPVYRLRSNLTCPQWPLSIRRKRHCRKVVGFLTRDEIEAILLAVDRSTWIGRRDYALLLTMLQTDLRLAKITGTA